MELLLFEWLTSGGLWQDGEEPDPNCPMQSQGREMLLAITEDFVRAGLKVVLPVDERLGDLVFSRKGLEKRRLGATDDLQRNLAELADRADYIMVIAPESNGCLSDCLRWLEPFCDKLISPDSDFARLTSNKQSTFERLKTNGFDSYPAGVNYADFLNRATTSEEPFPLSFPLVLKPIEGAGSEEVQLLENGSNRDLHLTRLPDQYRLEAFVRGTPVSVSMLCGRQSTQVLAPTVQIFDQQPIGRYVAAGYPVDSEITQRAIQLAIRASKALPATRGYIGMDLVISDNAEPGDCLIEINPRLTMSYLKLREIYPENLALLMLNGAIETHRAATRTWTFREPRP